MLEIFLISYFLTMYFGLGVMLDSKFVTSLINKIRKIELDKGVYLSESSLNRRFGMAWTAFALTPLVNYLIYFWYFMFKFSEKSCAD